MEGDPESQFFRCLGCRVQDGADPAQSFVVDGEPGPSTAPFPVQEPCFSHDLQVVTDGGLAQPQTVGQITDAGLAIGGLFQESKQLQAGGVGDGSQYRGQLFGFGSLQRLTVQPWPARATFEEPVIRHLQIYDSHPSTIDAG